MPEPRMLQELYMFYTMWVWLYEPNLVEHAWMTKYFTVSKNRSIYKCTIVTMYTCIIYYKPVWIYYAACFVVVENWTNKITAGTLVRLRESLTADWYYNGNLFFPIKSSINKININTIIGHRAQVSSSLYATNFYL